MDIAEKTLILKKDFDEVYEAGKKAEYERFWNACLENGTRTKYDYAFSGGSWNDATYNPPYDMKATSCINMFRESKITNVKKALDLSGVTSIYIFAYAYDLTDIPLIIVDKNTTYGNWFMSNGVLKNVTFQGEIASSIDFTYAPLLSKASMTSVINALSTTTTGLSVTFRKVAKEREFTTSEWDSLIATKPNWTFTLS